MTVKVPTDHHHRPGVPLKSAKDRMDIISAYRELGSYRAAAEVCGTTHKTVKRVVDRFEADDQPPDRKGRPATTMWSPSWSLSESSGHTAGSPPSDCCR